MGDHVELRRLRGARRPGLGLLASEKEKVLKITGQQVVQIQGEYWGMREYGGKVLGSRVCWGMRQRWVGLG